MWNKIAAAIEKEPVPLPSPWPTSFLEKIGGAVVFLEEREKTAFLAALSTVIETEEVLNLADANSQEDLLFKAAQLCDFYKNRRTK